MKEFISDYYLWFKAFHLIAVITWMAGIFYLPRLFVYHSKTKVGSETSEMFKTMEQKLLRIIMNPAMIVVWVLGLSMLWVNSSLMSYGWMHAKLTAVVLMTVYHHALVRWWKNFRKDKRNHSEKFYRYANEVPTILLIAIVIMAIVQPVFV